MKGLKLNDIIKFKNNKTLLHKILNKYIISKQEKLNIIKSLEDVAGSKTLITFYYDGKEYVAEKGMSWFDFCKSEYNVDGWYTDTDNISPMDNITIFSNDWGFGGEYRLLHYGDDASLVKSTEIILENHTYSFFTDGWGVGPGGSGE